MIIFVSLPNYPIQKEVKPLKNMQSFWNLCHLIIHS